MRLPAVCLVLVLLGGMAHAQPAAQEPPALAPGEVQRLLDGYELVQAQDFLALSDTEFVTFLPRLRALQEARRRNDQERLRLLAELRKMTSPQAQVSENELRDRVRTLRELETRAVAEIDRAIDGVDQTLDVRQQARFRIFEQQIEQRKLQLLMRARQIQQNRANRPPATAQ